MGSFDLYICPEYKDEYTIFEDMLVCYKEHFEEKEQNNTVQRKGGERY